MTAPLCRFCQSPLAETFADLGSTPLSNSYLRAEQLNRMEPFYPLHARVCSVCFLVQVEEYQRPETIFGDYSYFSSFSDSWLRHARDFAMKAISSFHLTGESHVVEIASNDGYLLQYFRASGIPVLGIEPAKNVARVAEEKGIPTLSRFFGTELARELVSVGQQADLLVGNNVLAHVPDLNDFVAGMKVVLRPGGIISMEFPHLVQMIQHNQFDTIYHEHFSYLSLCTVEKVFDKHGLKIFDVEEIPTHGGSIRVLACDADQVHVSVSRRVSELRQRELDLGIQNMAIYASFGERLRETKRALLEFLISAKRGGKSIAGYGAPAKGNTLLNYCGIGTDFLDYTVDISPHKQGHFLPGTHIPIYHPRVIRETRPDYVLILPWNLRDEIMEQLADIREWSGRFVVPIPKVEVIE
jgi:2-polyprenyl-3-methyl-5-hydroxy-6-metoxy-1,4-benzoquinol methylase